MILVKNQIFPLVITGANNADIKAYMKAWTTFGRRKILYQLIDRGLHRIEISKEQFNYAQQLDQIAMVDVPTLIEDILKRKDK